MFCAGYFKTVFFGTDMGNKHVCLIHTPVDNHYKDSDSQYAPPLALISLANFLHKNNDVKVSILDGSTICSIDEINKFIIDEQPDIIGQSVQLISYRNSLQIASVGKEIGATTILGGHHATQLAEQIISNQHFIIDYVVIGDGEEALSKIASSCNKECIQNLVYFANGNVIKNKRVNIPIGRMQTIDYSSVDCELYDRLIKNYTFSNNGKTIRRYLRFFSHKGCANRKNSSGCIFCGRSDIGIRFKSPKKYWEEILSIVIKHKADYIFDVGDDFLFNKKWIEEVAKSKPDIDAPYQIGIFGRANRIDKDIAPFLKKIGIQDVVIGFESGDDEILSACDKKNSNSVININAAEVLFSNEIDVCASFVLGLPNETDKTIGKTIECAERIVKIALKEMLRHPREMVANLIEPHPGSKIFNALKKEYPEKYIHNDILDLEEMQRDYFRIFFKCDTLKKYNSFRRKLKDAADIIHSFVPFTDSHGWTKNELKS